MFGTDVAKGFDIVIGNPPYGAEVSKDDINYFTSNYKLKSSETAILFIEKGTKLLSVKGSLCYIIPKSFTFASNYKKTRDYVESGLKTLVDCGKAFEQVKLEACIFNFTNGVKLKHYNSLKFNNDLCFEYLSKIDKKLVSIFGFYPNGLSEKEIEIGIKLQRRGKFLNDIASNSRGAVLQSHLKEKGDFMVIGGKEIDRYGIRGIKGFLNDEKLLTYKSKIHENSLLAQNIVAHLTSPLDHIKIISCLPKKNEKYSITDTINQITITDNEYACEFIWSLFSSTLINWFVYLFIYGKAIRTMHFDNAVTDRIPIPSIQKGQQKPFITIVDKILSAKEANPKSDTSALEKQIDEMVYKLYELTEEEIAIIENKK